MPPLASCPSRLHVPCTVCTLVTLSSADACITDAERVLAGVVLQVRCCDVM